MTINSLLGLALTLSFIKLMAFGISLPKNFDNLWRPGAFTSFPSSIYWIMAIIAVITLFVFIKKLSKTENKIKNYFFLYFAISYISLSLFNRTLGETNITYLFLLTTSDSSLSEIFPNIVLDLFFEPPYIFWFLIVMSVIYYIGYKFKHIEYSIPFWIIPFLFIDYRTNDMVVTFITAYSAIAILGIIYSKNKSSLILQTLLFINLLAGIIVSNNLLNFGQLYIKLAISSLLIFFIPSFILLWLCNKSTKDEVNSLTWILPLTSFSFSILPFYRLRTGDCFVFYVSFSNLYIVFANISTCLLFIAIISLIINKLIPKLKNKAFYLSSLLLLFFYILDAALYYYSQFRINYQTLVWTMTMNDIFKTTLTTCFNYLTYTSFILTISVLSISLILLYKSKNLFTNKSLKFNFLIIILISQISITLLQLSDPIPQTLRDPFFELIKSIPAPKYFQQHLSMEEIIKGFQECKLPLKNYNEKKVNKESIANKKFTNVILITLESVHWRYVNMFGKEPKTWPLISKLKDRMEIFPFIYSNFPDSTSADYALITSLIPYDHLFLHKNPDIIHKSLVNELKNYNYNTCLFSSESLNDGGLNNLIKSLPFDHQFSFNSYDNKYKDIMWSWGYKEDFTCKKILEFLDNRNINNPYFVWYRTVYPHAPFEILESNDKLLFQEKDEYGDLSLLARYQNALVYLDKVLYDFINKITELDKKNNQQTIIIMVGDHGEKLGEKDNNETAGHGLLTTPQLQNVVCIMIKPDNEGFKINNNIGSQIDITPTILDYLNITPSVERYEQGRSLYSNDLASRPIYLSSIQSYALIDDGYFFEFRDKNSPNFRVTKLNFSNNDFKPYYESLANWPDHKDIYQKYQRVKKFFELQKELLNQL